MEQFMFGVRCSSIEGSSKTSLNGSVLPVSRPLWWPARHMLYI